MMILAGYVGVSTKVTVGVVYTMTTGRESEATVACEGGRNSRGR